MKSKQILITTLLGLSFAFSPLLGIAADKQEVRTLVKKILNKEGAYEYDSGRGYKGKSIQKTEKIDEKNKREVYVGVKYSEPMDFIVPIEVGLTIEDWKEVGDNKYEMEQILIGDYGCDGTVDSYVKRGIVEEDGIGKLSYTDRKDLNDTKTRKEAEKIYDKYVKEMLDYTKKK